MGDASLGRGSAFNAAVPMEGGEEGALPSGTRVLIRGLLTRTDLNGRIGLISAFDQKKQRYELQAESVAGAWRVDGYACYMRRWGAYGVACACL